MPVTIPEGSLAYCRAAGRRLHFEVIRAHRSGTPLVFLHEGLGSVELWRGFPHAVVTATGRPGLVYSRYGNGWSDPLTEARPARYMHDEALGALPEVLAATGVTRPPVLVGHSDGASIAAVYAGAGNPVAGLVLIAPHVFVEPETVAAIGAIRDGFARSDMAARMARYHVAPEATFYGWADVWLSDDFRSWNIEEYLPAIGCPILLVQGTEDEYGTGAQLDAIEGTVTGRVRRVMVDGAGHFPHLSDGDPVAAAVADFIGEMR
ncbi:MAG TPA: alpha/beta hydrolase [Acidimicrobiia bacterium]|jgi:pimeloyl-ACP methyl ester carboxylesterase